MTSTLKQMTGGLALALGMSAGCSSAPATVSTQSSDPAVVETSIRESLTRLNALQLVSVYQLADDLPAEAYACYGVPCAGSQWVKPYQDDRARQSTQLAELVQIAETVNANPYIDPRPVTDAQAALDALSALQIVQASEMMLVQPRSNPNCYNLPCESDKQAADTENGTRIGKVFLIVDEAKKSGL